MKRKELEKKLRQAGCYLKREGGPHSNTVRLSPPAPKLARSFAPVGDAGSLVKFGGARFIQVPQDWGI